MTQFGNVATKSSHDAQMDDRRRPVLILRAPIAFWSVTSKIGCHLVTEITVAHVMY